MIKRHIFQSRGCKSLSEFFCLPKVNKFKILALIIGIQKYKRKLKKKRKKKKNKDHGHFVYIGSSGTDEWSEAVELKHKYS